MSVALPKTTYGAPIFVIKQGDTHNPITYNCADENNAIVPIQNAQAVHFSYRLQTSTTSPTKKTATVLNRDPGQLLYAWQTGDTAVAGDYYAEWIVTFQDGTIQTFPINGYQQFTIEAVLG